LLDRLQVPEAAVYNRVGTNPFERRLVVRHQRYALGQIDRCASSERNQTITVLSPVVLQTLVGTGLGRSNLRSGADAYDACSLDCGDGNGCNLPCTQIAPKRK
jgi:hypothetical protein